MVKNMHEMTSGEILRGDNLNVPELGIFGTLCAMVVPFLQHKDRLKFLTRNTDLKYGLMLHLNPAIMASCF